MLKGYENITYELTEEEIDLLPVIIKGLLNKKGKKQAVSGTKIQKSLNLSGARLRKIIGYIRTHDLIFGLCSTKSGYYVAENIKELNECMISLKQRIYTQMKTLHSLEKQSLMLGGTGQLTIFE
jgi:hypothetical protein